MYQVRLVYAMVPAHPMLGNSTACEQLPTGITPNADDALGLPAVTAKPVLHQMEWTFCLISAIVAKECSRQIAMLATPMAKMYTTVCSGKLQHALVAVALWLCWHPMAV